ncbi:hypothetical protein BDV26DRAFT_291547 [Aspergillus bertholletiae]|uniref:GPI anchored serine-threonine rich protein n=1 Tax=Aspergillus bertholletiae TaxID=1226010 RepID=A0A5N7BBU2_9EURO|nr:hypothetical protein BDV26DRAFT_291547 [Aspergillus bertholletiae]
MAQAIIQSASHPRQMDGMYKFLTLGALLATTALAADRSPALVARQVVELPCSYQGEKDCGSGCIPLSYTCCPDQRGGCPLGSYCDGLGCCPNGKTCTGPGGVITRPGSTISLTRTLTDTLTSTSTSTHTLTSSEAVPPIATPTSSSSSSSSQSVIPPPASSEVPSPSSTPAVPSSPSSSSSTPLASATSPPLHTGAASHLIPGFYAAAGLMVGAAIL